MSTVGYGDINANGNTDEQMAAIVCIIVGTGFYSYTIGNLTGIIASIDSENEEI